MNHLRKYYNSSETFVGAEHFLPILASNIFESARQNYFYFTNTTSSCIPQALEAFQSAVRHQFIPYLDAPRFASEGTTSELQTYISPLQTYISSLQGYNAPLHAYNAALQAYNAELQAYNSILQAYISEIGACKMEIVIHFAFSGLRKKI